MAVRTNDTVASSTFSARYSQIDPMTEKFEAILGYHGTLVESIFRRALQLANI